MRPPGRPKGENRSAQRVGSLMSAMNVSHATPVLPARPAPEPIAIIGMACIFPQAPDLASFWNNVVGCVDAVGEPAPNWDAERYLQSGRIKTPFGGYLKDLYRFDPREFGIMPNSMDGGEPDQFLALRVARDALLDAGYLGTAFDHTETGIILGHSTYLHRGQVTVVQNNIVLDQAVELLKAALPGMNAAALDQVRSMLAAKLPPTNSDTAPGLVPNVMTGRIANRLNLRGPNYLVDAACSSSLLAVGAAMDELRAGRSRLMLAGGVNASLPADVSAIFTQLGALSARGKVRPFESGSDGTLLGEGLGVVVLKRLSEALADGDRVYATLRGIGQASDGRGTGLLAPSVDGETLAIRRAYEGSGVDPATISMIEAHGTGIPLGDKTEIAALKNVFGERVASQGSIALGSVKSMISHCIPAAGIAGLIKTSLALHHRVLPPTLCENVNPELGLERTRLFINTETTPWIAPLGLPRRAGVDSFGFGGINTHAIVEQAPPAAVRPATLTRWPFELCVFSADTLPELITSVERLSAGLARNPGWRLDEIAAALAAADADREMRLALVVKSRDALPKALAGALGKLRESRATSWSTRGGACFGSERLSGKLAFIFPGEGSQYLGMFADLAMCFDEVQHWLDFWRGLYADEPGDTRTDIAFPPASELTPERRKLLEARLHDMDVGSEAVMVGGQAMFALLESLGVKPDVMLGHSSGESSALAASEALPLHDAARLADFIRQLNAIYQRVLAEGKIPTGALLAVGALPADMVHEQMAALAASHAPNAPEGTIAIAMDNCANQLVLYGTRTAIDALQARLITIGGICMPLPFDRGYHTSAFDAASAAFLAYYKTIKLGVPKVPLYSCASAQRFPDSPAAVRKLAAAQWSATVRFRETVLKMVDDGVSCFVEVGPSGNLTAFVGDILSDQPHLALATNLRRKHGLEQVLATLAQLYVHGKPVTLGKLFVRRRIDLIDLNGTVAPPKAGVLLDNTMPMLRLNDADRALLQGLAVASMPDLPAVAPDAPASKESAALIESAPVDHADLDGNARAQVMCDYFDVMRGFLAQQHEVLAGWQARPGDVDHPQIEEAPPHSSMPFLDRIIEHDDVHLRAQSQLSVHSDAFLRDHVLSGRGSATDPDLIGLACVPLMVSLEIMAEACALLARSTQVCTIENVRAFDWIALDDGELVVEVAADLVDAISGRYSATLRQGGAVAVTAEFGFAPDWRIPASAPLGAVQPARWNGQEVYDIGMFHGPTFQTLRQIQGWNAEGIDAELSACNLDGFFERGSRPPLVLNPVLLDAMGQLAACWIAEHVGTDFNCFPSTIARVELFEPRPAAQPGIVLRGRQHALDPAQAGDITSARAWAFECVDAAGQPLVRVDQLVNVFFKVPNRFYQARRDPLLGWLGAPLTGPDGVLLWQLENLSEEFCAQSNGIFLRMLAHATLSFAEREEWRSLGRNTRQRRQWLLGRVCLKEAVRYAIHTQGGELLYPSEVDVLHDEQGAPLVDGWWTAGMQNIPQVSLSHNHETNIAALSFNDTAIGVDVETIGRVQRPELLESALTGPEKEWLAGRAVSEHGDALLRLWCAKEAASKLLGTGLQGQPEAFEVVFESGSADHAWVQSAAVRVSVHVQRLGNSVIAVADTASKITKVH